MLVRWKFGSEGTTPLSVIKCPLLGNGMYRMCDCIDWKES